MTPQEHAPIRVVGDPAHHDQPGAQPEPFVIVAATADGTRTVPAPSARAAQTIVRHLVEYYPDAQIRWQANPHLAAGSVAVFGCARPLADGQLLDQPVHAFKLACGQPTPSVWVALCSVQVEHILLEALDQGMGTPCPGCHHRWSADHCQSVLASPSSTPTARPSAVPVATDGDGTGIGQPGLEAQSLMALVATNPPM